MKPGDVVVGVLVGAQETKVRPAVVIASATYLAERQDVVVGILTPPCSRPNRRKIVLGAGRFAFLMRTSHASGGHAASRLSATFPRTPFVDHLRGLPALQGSISEPLYESPTITRSSC
ncbi:MAG: hypothetical protein ABJF23_27455 [Bryobacteraceae bacterium]